MCVKRDDLVEGRKRPLWPSSGSYGFGRAGRKFLGRMRSCLRFPKGRRFISLCIFLDVLLWSHGGHKGVSGRVVVHEWHTQTESESPVIQT